MEDGRRVWQRQFFYDCFHFAYSFIITRFEHCNREANIVAHDLARLARFSLSSDWFKEASNETLTILINDVLVISNE